MNDLGRPLERHPVVLLCDKERLCWQTIQPIMHTSIKHIDVHCLFLWHHMKLGQLMVRYVKRSEEAPHSFFNALGGKWVAGFFDELGMP